MLLQNSESSECVRRLHRITPLEDWPPIEVPASDTARIAIVDLETTGFDPRRDVAIEFAGALVSTDGAGRICRIEDWLEARQDPGFPLPRRIAQLTGLTDAELAGNQMDRREIAEFVGSADAILAHNAGFDRPFLEEIVPEAAGMPWICSMADIDWLALGFDGAKLGHLLMQTGRFNPRSHRALDDVAAVVNLLDHRLPDGSTVHSEILRGAAQPSWRFEATGASYARRGDLRHRGYRWCDGQVWHKHVREPDYFDELAWYSQVIGGAPSIVELDRTTRYRGDWTWRPKRR
jgi:DNA polymerase III subunit epsilon